MFSRYKILTTIHSLLTSVSERKRNTKAQRNYNCYMSYMTPTRKFIPSNSLEMKLTHP